MFALFFALQNYFTLIRCMIPIFSGINTIENNGYPAELHFVITKDGYNLTIHRIPHGKNSTRGGIPVLLLHGLLGASDNFLFMGAGKSVSFILAEQGYDVWVANSRGNTHSRKHIKLNPDRDRAFWKFSWHEVGVIDVPDMIDYILNETGYQKLHYIGHSQGTTVMLVCLSARPEYNQKVISASLYAPSAYLRHVAQPALIVASISPEFLEWIADFLRIDEIILPGINEALQTILERFCGLNNLFKELCAFFTGFGNAYTTVLLDKNMMPTLVSMAPAGASTRQAIHYAQLIRFGLFREYNHGERNMAIYKQREPPLYPVKKISAPIGLFYARGDMLCTPIDVESLSKDLKSVKLKYLVPFTQFGHLDFVIAYNAKELVYDAALEFMRNMEKIRQPLK